MDHEVPKLSKVYTDKGVADASKFGFFIISKGAPTTWATWRSSSRAPA